MTNGIEQNRETKNNRATGPKTKVLNRELEEEEQESSTPKTENESEVDELFEDEEIPPEEVIELPNTSSVQQKIYEILQKPDPEAGIINYNPILDILKPLSIQELISVFEALVGHVLDSFLGGISIKSKSIAVAGVVQISNKKNVHPYDTVKVASEIWATPITDEEIEVIREYLRLKNTSSSLEILFEMHENNPETIRFRRESRDTQKKLAELIRREEEELRTLERMVLNELMREELTGTVVIDVRKYRGLAAVRMLGSQIEPLIPFIYLMPVLGSAIGFTEAITGRSFLDGKKINGFERWVGLLPFAAGFILRASVKLARAIAAFVKATSYSIKQTIQIIRTVRRIYPEIKSMREILKIVKATKNTLKILDNLPPNLIKSLENVKRQLKFLDSELKVAAKSGKGIPKASSKKRTTKRSTSPRERLTTNQSSMKTEKKTTNVSKATKPRKSKFTTEEIAQSRKQLENRGTQKPSIERTHTVRKGGHARLGEKATDSQILRSNMERKGIKVPDGHEAHHIVPVKDGGLAGENVRAILKKHGIDINSADNGIALPNKKIDPRLPREAPIRHQPIHTERYYKQLEIDLTLEASNPFGNVRGKLHSIRRRIANGEYQF